MSSLPRMWEPSILLRAAFMARFVFFGTFRHNRSELAEMVFDGDRCATPPEGCMPRVGTRKFREWEAAGRPTKVQRASFPPMPIAAALSLVAALQERRRELGLRRGEGAPLG